MGRPITAEKRAAILEMNQKRRTVKWIASKLKTGYATVRNAIELARETDPTTPPPVMLRKLWREPKELAVRMEEMRRIAKAGGILADYSSATGKGYLRVRNWLDRNAPEVLAQLVSNYKHRDATRREAYFVGKLADVRSELEQLNKERAACETP